MNRDFYKNSARELFYKIPTKYSYGTSLSKPQPIKIIMRFSYKK